ncbi:MAG TPA: mandelate racemase/muconate lactonizing enzyme family protein [Anaerolineae bacterium]|nr:mandelate racemase/muconate lactonizing enzyme family protein [Anaerolineae bacterium]
MKITDVRVLRMQAHTEPHNNWLFVRIHTDSGITGIGEGSLQYKDASLAAELENFGTYLRGKDPFQIEHIWTSLHRRVTWTGGAVTLSAISAIDLALWDIKGKALGVPVYELTGGKVRDRVPLYANGWFSRNRASAHGPQGGSPGEAAWYAEQAKDVVAQGYRCLKVYPFSGVQVITPERIARGVGIVRAIREAVGPNVEIAVDVRRRLNIWSARRIAQKLEPLDIAWLEEPILFDNPTAMAQFARSVRVPVSTGEESYTRWEFRELLEQNAVGIIQPDICHAGGMSELRKIAAMAETYYVTLAPHNSNGPISTVASLHLDMSINNCHMQELFLNSLDLCQEVLTNPLIIQDGYGAPPDGPGWGTDLDDAVVAKHPPSEFTPVESEPYMEF